MVVWGRKGTAVAACYRAGQVAWEMMSVATVFVVFIAGVIR